MVWPWSSVGNMFRLLMVCFGSFVSGVFGCEHDHHVVVWMSA